VNIQSIKQRFGIIGRSEQLDRALSKALRVANTDLSVLIQGESGVGKEVISKIIHQLSARKHNTFIAINTGALPEGTINSELFGHEKGAFTGAISDRKGYFETANGGTIFLDEVGEMPLDTQAYLLRVLESGEFIRVGSSAVQRTDVRVIAATNVNLLDRVRQGKFRDDLYYRLNTVPILVPALRERPEDIYMLFRKFTIDFAEKYRGEPIALDQEAKAMLLNYSWPGNIRELRNVAEQLSLLSDDPLISIRHLLDVAPAIDQRHLPVLSGSKSQESIDEREILYKVLFEMRNDFNDLKELILELIRNNDLEVSNTKSLRPLALPRHITESELISVSESGQDRHSREEEGVDFLVNKSDYQPTSSLPLIVTKDKYDESEVVDDNLSLESMERDLIGKALKKYGGRRKEAAAELGISERTLYRKIKNYDM